MKNPLMPFLNWVAKKFRKDPSGMLIITGVAGWTLSSIAQIGAILINPKIPDEQKSFLVPQEFADAAANIGLFFLITQMAKMSVSKLFSTGKFQTATTKKFIQANKKLFEDKIGKVDFNIEKLLPDNSDVLKGYKLTKSFAETVATVGGGIISSNILTPIIRNNMASKMQKNYVENTKPTEIKKPEARLQTYPNTTFRSSYGMRI